MKKSTLILPPIPDLDTVRTLAFMPLPNEEELKNELIRAARDGCYEEGWPCHDTHRGHEWAMTRFYLNVAEPSRALVDHEDRKFRVGTLFETLLTHLARPLNYATAVAQLAKLYQDNIGVSAGFRAGAVYLASALTWGLRPDLEAEAAYEVMRDAARSAGADWPENAYAMGAISEVPAALFVAYRKARTRDALAHGMYYLYKHANC